MYLFPHNNEIYQNRVSIAPNWFTRLAWRIGAIKIPFSKEQLEEGEKIVLSGAMETIDRLSDPKAIAERRKAKKAIKKKMKESKDCVWQAQEIKDGMYYFCLTHKELIPMEDNIRPNHK